MDAVLSRTSWKSMLSIPRRGPFLFSRGWNSRSGVFSVSPRRVMSFSFSAAASMVAFWCRVVSSWTSFFCVWFSNIWIARAVGVWKCNPHNSPLLCLFRALQKHVWLPACCLADLSTCHWIWSVSVGMCSAGKYPEQYPHLHSLTLSPRAVMSEMAFSLCVLLYCGLTVLVRW